MDPLENGSVRSPSDQIHLRRTMINWMASRIPWTRIKLFGARILYVVLRIFLRSNHVQVKRDGIQYHLDLSEGIDLSIFIFGHFQPKVVNNPFYTMPQDAVVFDVGANMGGMTLAFAKHAPYGTVHAFEPTDYAFKKLLKNIDLNPYLKPRIVPVKCFVGDRSLTAPVLFTAASWKTDAFFSKGHPLHGGIDKSTGHAPGITLDDYCETNKISRLDLIKIDTEGHEITVIKGAMGVITTFKPVIIFEVGKYMLDEKGVRFMDFITLLGNHGYTFASLKNGQVIDPVNFRRIIPRRSTIDIIARP